MAGMVPGERPGRVRHTIPVKHPHAHKPPAHRQDSPLAFTSNAAILRAVNELSAKVGLMSDQQAEIATDVAAIQAGVQALTVADTAIQAEIAALKAANPQLDLSALDKAAASLTPAVASITALAPPAA